MRLVLFILPFFVASVSGSKIRKVVYREGAVEDDRVSSSSSLEEIPPREEWFRVKGDHPEGHYSPQQIVRDEHKVIALSTSRTPTRVVIGNAFNSRRDDLETVSEREGSPISNGQMQVNVRHRGKLGFQERGLKEDRRMGEAMVRRGDEDGGDEWEEITKVPPVSKLRNKNGRQENWHLHIRHEAGHHELGKAKSISNRPQEPQEPKEREAVDNDDGRSRRRHDNEPLALAHHHDEQDSVPIERDEDYEYDAVSSSRNVNNGRRVKELTLYENDNSQSKRPSVLLKVSRGQNEIVSGTSDTENGSVEDSESPPPHEQVARMARYIVQNSNWTSAATISTMDEVKGFPFVNIFSVSDGPNGNSSGIPYMFLTPLDMSVIDLKSDSRASLTMSLAQSDYCKQQQYDPEDPRCAKVILSGRIVPVTNKIEKQFARNALYSKHPDMQGWPKDHGFFFAKLDIKHIVVLDYFGGAKPVTLDDYFNQSSL